MAMKYLSVLLVSIFILVSISCDTLDDSGIDPDPLITAEIADSQTYNLVTPVYGMQVSIKNGVDRSDQGVLDILDRRATQFLDCQFAEGSQLGFEQVMLDDGTIVPPLSDLRVFVVPIRYKCDVPGTSVCNGTYFSGVDIVTVAEGGFAGCDVFLPWKHELGHRYGMELDHSNQSDFQSCIGDSSCDIGDIFD
ncbi:MAG: hypothetical protein DHS20C13_19270 [Thermodesulfobacteriota bacterium]|nr:MAG: hypothetical protein DHS20C13_19270 [Thermodesulfobacteriota bacterium]